MGSGTYNSEGHIAEGKAMYPVTPKQAHPIVYGQSVYGGNRLWSIGAQTAYPEPFKGTFHDGAFQINNTTWCKDAHNPLTTNETYNKISWASEQVPATSDIEKSWREWSGSETPDRYMQTTSYRVSPGSLYTGAGVPDELSMKWNQVAECIRNETWNAIYAKSDAEYQSIVDRMIKDAKSYGYDDCCAHTQKQATKRAAAEKLARGEK